MAKKSLFGWLEILCGGESETPPNSSTPLSSPHTTNRRNSALSSQQSSVLTAASLSDEENLRKSIELTKRGIRRFLQVAQTSGISDLWFWGRTRLKSVSTATPGKLWLKRGIWEIQVDLSYPVSATLTYSVSRLTALLVGQAVIDRWTDECAENGFKTQDVIGLDFSSTGEWLVIGAKEGGDSVRERLLRILAVLRYMKDLRSRLKKVVLSNNVRHRLAYGSRTVVPQGSPEMAAGAIANNQGLCVRRFSRQQLDEEEESIISPTKRGEPGRTPKHQLSLIKRSDSIESGELLRVKIVGRRS